MKAMAALPFVIFKYSLRRDVSLKKLGYSTAAESKRDATNQAKPLQKPTPIQLPNLKTDIPIYAS